MPENPVIEQEEFIERLVRVTQVVSGSEDLEQLTSSGQVFIDTEEYGFRGEDLLGFGLSIAKMNFIVNRMMAFHPQNQADLLAKMFLMGVIYARQEMSDASSI